MIAPPLPPWRVDIRRTASRAHSIAPRDVDCEDVRERHGRQILDPREASGYSCIVDETADRTEFSHCFVEQPQDIFFTRDIGFDRDRPATLARNRVDNLISAGFVARIVDRDGDAGPRDQLRHCRADSPAGTRHD